MVQGVRELEKEIARRVDGRLREAVSRSSQRRVPCQGCEYTAAAEKCSMAIAFSLLVYTEQPVPSAAFPQEKPHFAALACAE